LQEYANIVKKFHPTKKAPPHRNTARLAPASKDTRIPCRGDPRSAPTASAPRVEGYAHLLYGRTMACPRRQKPQSGGQIIAPGGNPGSIINNTYQAPEERPNSTHGAAFVVAWQPGCPSASSHHYITPYSLFLTPYSLLLIPYSLLLTPYSLLLTPYSLLLTPYFHRSLSPPDTFFGRKSAKQPFWHTIC
jgi:hypothetical protein